ncbi:MAG: carboxyltransferase domain-containing protein, partial [Saprospiraceae bacterium]|nr:carboxyltransferase domain-containing protein [Saprospiraceae bacterium]
MDKLNLTASGPMSFHQLSSTALLLNFTQHIDPRVNEEVFQVKLYLESKKLVGVLYYIPAYCSLSIGFDPD